MKAKMIRQFIVRSTLYMNKVKLFYNHIHLCYIHLDVLQCVLINPCSTLLLSSLVQCLVRLQRTAAGEASPRVQVRKGQITGKTQISTVHKTLLHWHVWHKKKWKPNLNVVAVYSLFTYRKKNKGNVVVPRLKKTITFDTCQEHSWLQMNTSLRKAWFQVIFSSLTSTVSDLCTDAIERMDRSSWLQNVSSEAGVFVFAGMRPG